MDIPAYKVLPFTFYFRVLGISVLCGIPVWLSRSYLIGEEQVLVGLAWSIPLYLTIFTALGTLLNIITRDDWKKLRSWLSLKFLWA